MVTPGSRSRGRRQVQGGTKGNFLKETPTPPRPGGPDFTKYLQYRVYRRALWCRTGVPVTIEPGARGQLSTGDPLLRVRTDRPVPGPTPEAETRIGRDGEFLGPGSTLSVSGLREQLRLLEDQPVGERDLLPLVGQHLRPPSPFFCDVRTPDSRGTNG